MVFKQGGGRIVHKPFHPAGEVELALRGQRLEREARVQVILGEAAAHLLRLDELQVLMPRDERLREASAGPRSLAVGTRNTPRAACSYA